MEEEYIHQELSGKIISAAMYVLNELKPGLDEKIYENSLTIELRRRGHAVEQQRLFPVYFRDIEVGTLIPDMIVDGLVIVDPKVVTAFNEHHLAQMTGYLSITHLHLALLLNFKFSKLQIKRVIRSSSAYSA
jgi:GxxExxY protein